MLILAVESSCDETSVALVKDGKEVLSHEILSQINIHKKFGGVVPEIASRNHVVHMTRLFDTVLKEAKITPDLIDLVAVTQGPGLIGSLLVGINAACAFAYANNLPIVGINHMMGHIYGAHIENDFIFPAIVLLVSGGHTELLLLEDHMKVKLLGTTLDDAVGEAYDKVGRVLGLSYPGGPVIDRLAKNGKDLYHFPRATLNKNEYNFSYSGLKSAVINKVHNMNQKGETYQIEDVCRSFQDSAIEVLVEKTKKAAFNFNAKQIIVAGGVAANKGLRELIKNEITHIPIVMPSMIYCTDNAAMIGAAAYYHVKRFGVLKDYLLGGNSALDYEMYD